MNNKNINKEYHEYKSKRKFNKIINYIRTKINPKTKINKIAVIIPFRDLSEDKFRTKQLQQFLKHFKTFLQGYNYHIFIIQQSNDNRRFNRGQLLNIGMDITTKLKYDSLITHDVDLLPNIDMLPYYVIKYKIPAHLGWRWKSKYNFWTFFGGIVVMTPTLCKITNGYPNDSWGWGSEDDILYNRIARTIGFIARPKTGTIKELTHDTPSQEEININRKQDVLKDFNNWKNNGMNSLDYKIIDTESHSYYTIHTVQLS